MRILHITSEYPPFINGGLARAVGGLVSSCKQAGIEVYVIHIRKRQAYSRLRNTVQNTIHERIVYPKVIDELELPSSIEKCANIIQYWKPDIVHLHTFDLLLIAKYIKSQLGTPLVYTVHTIEREEEYRDMMPLEYILRCSIQQNLLHFVDRIIALSQKDKESLLRYYPELTSRIRVIGNGIDSCTFCPNVAAKTQRKDHYSNTVLYVGRFVERKGVRDLLLAIPAVLNEIPNTNFIFVGGQPSVNEEHIKNAWMPQELLKYKNKIKFTGWISTLEVHEIYNSADILVIPSKYEPFGLVILEGMLHRLPIIASSTGGPLEILHHERTALLFPPGNIDALSSSIIRLLKDSLLRQRLSNAGVEEIQQKWSWVEKVKTLKNVYQEILTC